MTEWNISSIWIPATWMASTTFGYKSYSESTLLLHSELLFSLLAHQEWKWVILSSWTPSNLTEKSWSFPESGRFCWWHLIFGRRGWKDGHWAVRYAKKVFMCGWAGVIVLSAQSCFSVCNLEGQQRSKRKNTDVCEDWLTLDL